MKTRTIILAIVILMMALLTAVAMYAGVRIQGSRIHRVVPEEIQWFDGAAYFPGNVQLMLSHIKGVLDDNPEVTREAKRIIETNHPGEYIDGTTVWVDWDMRNEKCKNLRVVLMFKMSTGMTRGTIFDIDAQPRRGEGRVE